VKTITLTPDPVVLRHDGVADPRVEPQRRHHAEGEGRRVPDVAQRRLHQQELRLSFVLHTEARDFENWANPDYYFTYDNPEVKLTSSRSRDRRAGHPPTC
jgi:hypothetical protein